VVAVLNKEVHELHVALYPERFKEYHFEAVNDFFKKVMTNPNFYFYLIGNEQSYIGYVWIEIKEYHENAFMKAYKSVFVHQLNIAKDYWTDNEIAKKFYEKTGYKRYREFVYKDCDVHA
jgi:hypothetical protein